ncbi:unnamed protein product [marine sediment metagenome]|uniref:Uncharacterized protein n=1 Tax=marine sediment metagenome TaxID=412755 RepID=X1UWK1_9ZZZZ
MRIIPYHLMPQAIVTGGLHGRARGNVNGIVYGAARTRIGKVVTAREYVYPSITEDEKVVKQRLIFKCALHAVQYLGATLWEDTFDRSIGQLPGFQSMMSIILKNSDRDTRDLGIPPNTPLGNLFIPGIDCITHTVTAGSITCTWDTGLGLNGTDDDLFQIFGVEKVGSEEGVRGAVDFAAEAVRSLGTLDIPTGSSGTDWIVGCFFKGAGVAAGKLSICRWYEVTSMV